MAENRNEPTSAQVRDALWENRPNPLAAAAAPTRAPVVESLGCNNSNQKIKDTVCIDTLRVYDSCADKDCLADLRVYFTDCTQDIIDNATSVRCRSCEVLKCFIDVEEVPFNRGFYSVDMTFFFKVTLDVFTNAICPPTTVSGLCTFSKKAILFGSEGNVKIFSSEYSADSIDDQFRPATTAPIAKVQCVDPICLDARLCRPCDCNHNYVMGGVGIPESIRRHFPGNFLMPSQERAVRVTLGLFTIVQLAREVQILIPSFDFCIPTKECSFESDDPCDAFRRINFPLNEFFPPDSRNLDANELPNFGGCGCGT